MADDALIVWMDLEMTGLDPQRERIIEAATLLTDGDLNIVAEGPELVIHQPDSLLEAMDEWNTEHHTASGLVERVRASTVSEQDAEAQILAFVSQHCAERMAPLAGNSIQHDRSFLSLQMPGLSGYLHYRNIDVSTIKELTRRWYPDIAAAAPKKKGSHRALEDIKESIEELRYYRATVFIPVSSK